jgi:hypothetical protein
MGKEGGALPVVTQILVACNICADNLTTEGKYTLT